MSRNICKTKQRRLLLCSGSWFAIATAAIGEVAAIHLSLGEVNYAFGVMIHPSSVRILYCIWEDWLGHIPQIQLENCCHCVHIICVYFVIAFIELLFICKHVGSIAWYSAEILVRVSKLDILTYLNIPSVWNPSILIMTSFSKTRTYGTLRSG